MKLSIRLGGPYDNGLVLCDENGRILPMQKGLTVSSKAADTVNVTVEFVMGDDLQFSLEPPQR